MFHADLKIWGKDINFNQTSMETFSSYKLCNEIRHVRTDLDKDYANDCNIESLLVTAIFKLNTPTYFTMSRNGVVYLTIRSSKLLKLQMSMSVKWDKGSGARHKKVSYLD